MKLTQNDIATIEQAHDYLLDKVKLRFDVPLLSRLRDLSNGMIKKMNDVDDTLFIISKDEIYNIYHSGERLDMIESMFSELFEIELNKWYYIDRERHSYSKLEEPYHIFLKQNDNWMFFGNVINDRYFSSDGMGLMRADIKESNKNDLKKLFIKHIIKKKFTDNPNDISFNESITMISCKGVLIYDENGFVKSPLDLEEIEKQKQSSINNLVKEAKKLEQKHGLKITLTFE